MMSDLHQKNVVIVQHCAFRFVALTATKALSNKVLPQILVFISKVIFHNTFIVNSYLEIIKP